MIVALLVGMFGMSGCGTTVYRLESKCDAVTTDSLFKSISILLIQKNFSIKQLDANDGYLEASTFPEWSVWTGMTSSKIWTFQKINDKIVASAKTLMQSQNMFGATTGSSVYYYSDKCHEDWDWYWDIRYSLEEICGNKIVIIKTETN